MDKYEQLSIVGEGSYGLVMKCRHRETDQIVAIKKFLETEDDVQIRKMALREIKILKKLRHHENLVTMIEVFRHRKRFYLVFEYLEGTVLDELDKTQGRGLGEEKCRERIFQVARAIHYCHSNNIIHRDVKPENVLVSSLGVVKLCDFGFARNASNGEHCTEYVATRWYRAPELLIGESNYGTAVDIWALGCLFAEMMTGDPLFPGESDIDQLFLIVKTLGKPCSKHMQIILKKPDLKNVIRMPEIEPNFDIRKTFQSWPLYAVEFLISCTKMDPMQRATSDELLQHFYFTHDKFPQRFLPDLREKCNVALMSNPLLRKFKTEHIISTLDRGNNNLSLTKKDATKFKFSMENEGKVMEKIQRKSTYRKVNNNIEIQMFEKSLESLHTNKDEFFNYENNNKLPLHPTINNISFNRDNNIKKSPNFLLQNLQNKYSHVPLFTGVTTRSKFPKKYENCNIDNSVNNITTPLWLNTRRREKKLNNTNNNNNNNKNDEFSLPNLQTSKQVLSSPNKVKKKSFPELPHSNEITPEYRYKRAKRKRNTLDISLPLPVKHK